MKLITDEDEIYKELLNDPAFTEAVHRDEKGVYLLRNDDQRRYITQLTTESKTKAVIKFERLLSRGDNILHITSKDGEVDQDMTLGEARVREIFKNGGTTYWLCALPEVAGTLDIISEATKEEW